MVDHFVIIVHVFTARSAFEFRGLNEAGLCTRSLVFALEWAFELAQWFLVVSWGGSFSNGVFHVSLVHFCSGPLVV